MPPTQHRICLWAGPRNVSTALMYAFARRSDAFVIDEPLYAHYLRVSGADHPGREDVLRAQDSDGAVVVRDLILADHDRPVVFMKQMAHHLIDLDLDFLRSTTNVLLIRDPAEALPSLARQIPRPELADTGMAMQERLLRDLADEGKTVPVLDAREVLLDPAGVLQTLCERIRIPFERSMLSWPAGARPEDGVWAPHWYGNVHRSTGFAPYRRKTEPFPEELRLVLDECRPIYDRLYAEAIRADGRRPS